mmetsp:Transcript_54438/g.81020  ORF Transcript_54438/g.81020 Transcript_54438/m.81020 type:complete len:179 (+) Transcript_54438:227-763(+)
MVWHIRINVHVILTILMMFVPISFVTPSNSFSSSFDLGNDRRLKTGREFTPPNRMEEAAAAAAVAADDKNATGLFRNSGGGIGRTASLSFEDVVEKDDISSIDSGNAAPLPLRSCSNSNFLCSSSAFYDWAVLPWLPVFAVVLLWGWCWYRLWHFYFLPSFLLPVFPAVLFHCHSHLL